MCLLVCAWQIHDAYPFILVGNRDEFYKRPASRAAWWEDGVVLAGKDLTGGGTWMGSNKWGQVAVLTNYRNPADNRKDAPTRGHLVSGFLANAHAATDYLTSLPSLDPFNGFNMLLMDGSGLYYASNRSAQAWQALGSGLYGLSNHLLDTPWPKVEASKSAVNQAFSAQSEEELIEKLFEAMADKERAPDALLPQTGVPLEWEQMLSARFIESEHYGTRVTTVILIDRAGKVYFEERSFVPKGIPVSFRFTP